MMHQFKKQSRYRDCLPWECGRECGRLNAIEFGVYQTCLDHLNVDNEECYDGIATILRHFCSMKHECDRIIPAVHRIASRMMAAHHDPAIICTDCLRFCPFPEMRDTLYMYGASIRPGMNHHLVTCVACGRYVCRCMMSY